MDEIAALQKQLAAVQLTETALRLSERNIVEIVMKMMELGMLKGVIMTQQREYVTQRQLEREILDELLVRGGRVNIVELQPALGVDLSIIQARAADIAARDDSVLIVKGELIASYYLDSLAQEVNEWLQEAGRVGLDEVSSRFTLDLEFLQGVIVPRLGLSILGKLDQGALFTQAYMQRHTAQIRGLFSAMTRPTNVGAIIKQYNFNEGIFYSVLQRLLDEGRVDGVVRGGGERAVYYPALFTRVQHSSIEQFYRQNDYIEYSRIAKLDIANPRQYMESRHKGEGLALDTCFVSRALLGQVDANVEEALASGSYLDVGPLVPAPFTPADTAALLDACPALQRRGSPAVILGEAFVVSRAFLDGCVARYEERLRKAAERVVVEDPPTEPPAGAAGSAEGYSEGEPSDEDGGKLTAPPRKGAPSPAAGAGKKGGPAGKSPAPAPSPPPAGGKKGGKGAAAAAAGAKGGDSDDEPLTKKKAKKGGPAGPRAAAAGGRKGAPGAKEEGPAETGPLAKAEVVRALREWHGEADGELLRLVAERIRPALLEADARLKAALFTGPSPAAAAKDGPAGAAARKQREALREKAGALYEAACLQKRAADHVDESGREAVERHVAKTTLAELHAALVESHALALGLPLPPPAPGARGGQVAPPPPALVEQVLGHLSKSIAGPLAALAEALGPRRTLEEGLVAAEAALEASRVPAKRPDRKRERQLVHRHKAALGEELAAAEDPALALHAAASLLYANAYGCAVNAPGKSLPALIEALKRAGGEAREEVPAEAPEAAGRRKGGKKAAKGEEKEQEGAGAGAGAVPGPLLGELEEAHRAVVRLLSARLGGAAASQPGGAAEAEAVARTRVDALRAAVLALARSKGPAPANSE